MIAGVLAVAGTAAAAPKPKPVEIKAFRDKLIVLSDAMGGLYLVLPGDDPRVWFAAADGQPFYEQVRVGRFANKSTGVWSYEAWTPRLANVQSGSIRHEHDDSFVKRCGNEHRIDLARVPTAKGKAILDKAKVFSTAMLRAPHLLARDDTGTYYYVDAYRKQYGGQGYRVFVGRKGAMKQLPLRDVASDTGGEVYSTRTGNLRLVTKNSEDGSVSFQQAVWIRGQRRTQLITLDVDANSEVIFKELGVYRFLGTICDDF